MKEISIEQKGKHRTVLYIYILIALLILLVTASYTWFSLSHTPRVSDMEMYVSAGTGIELAQDYDAEDEDWGQTLDFQNIVGADTELKPSTWSVNQGGLVTADYGTDGRIIGTKFSILSDYANANRNDAQAYYVKGSFYARTDAKVQVSLGEAIEVNEGENTAGTYVIGTPVWNSQSILHDDMGSGAETAIRIGLRITPVDTETGEENGTSEFYIYEPNYDSHIDPNITGDSETASIDGGNTLIDSAHLIRQTTSSWTEAYPVQQNVTIKTLGEFTTETDLFSLDVGEMVKIDLYIWLEGQDVDCTNVIESAQIIANVQFATDYTGQYGLEEIPTN